MLRLAVEQFGALTWTDVRDVVQNPTLDAAREVLRWGMRSEAVEWWNWLCGVFRAASEVESTVAREVRWPSLGCIQQELTEEDSKLLTFSDRSMLVKALRADLVEYAEHVDQYGPDSDADWAEGLARAMAILDADRVLILKLTGFQPGEAWSSGLRSASRWLCRRRQSARR